MHVLRMRNVAAARYVQAGVGAWLVLAACSATGCQTGERRVVDAPAPPVPDVDQLRATAARLWDARVAEDWVTAFEYLPAEQRSSADAQEYAAWAAANEPLVVEAYELGLVETDGPLGWVEVRYTAGVRKFPDVPARDAARWENWYAVDGRWLLVPPTRQKDFPAPPAQRDLAAEKVLRARVEEWVQTRIYEDGARLWTFIDPEDRARYDEDEFLKREIERKRTLAGELQWVEVVGDRGRVQVAYQSKPIDPSMTKIAPQWSREFEPWVRVDGEWYFDLSAVR